MIQDACLECLNRLKLNRVKLQIIGMTGSWAPIKCDFCDEHNASLMVDCEEPTFATLGQSLAVGGHTFGTTIQGDKITSWRVDGAEVAEAEFEEALKEARTSQSRPAGQ